MPGPRKKMKEEEMSGGGSDPIRGLTPLSPYLLISLDDISAVKGIANIIPMLEDIPLIVSSAINAV